MCTLFSAQPAWATLTIHVSPHANAELSFKKLKSFPSTPVSITQAISLLNTPELRDANGEPKENITIKLESGIYRLKQVLNLDVTSSGSEKYTVKIEGAKGAKSIISGGLPVNGFKPITDAEVLARIPAVARLHVLQANLSKQGVLDFGQHNRRGFGLNGIVAPLEVFYRKQPMQPARWPNEGFAKIATIPDGNKGRTFTVEGANFSAWHDEPNLSATGYWFYHWADETIPSVFVDPVSGQFTLPLPTPSYGIKIGQPVFFQNILAELDQPGEWYLDRNNGILYFWPPRKLRKNDVEVSVQEKLLVVHDASNISISGLTFENVRGDAITVNGGQNVEISNSIIRNIGNRAAIFRGMNSGLVDMKIENIGEGGVALAGGDRQTLKPGNLYIERSTIQNFGRLTRTYQPGISLSGVGNRIVGNKIFNSPHAAIVFLGNDHLISKNEIFDVCKETGDAGAIYTGRDWTARGTVISDNHIHDIVPNGNMGGTIGVYLDDQASGITVRGNQFERLSMAILIGGGRDNLIEDNKFIDTAIAIHLDARGKALKDDPNSTLHKRLLAVPYNQSPYKERYPHLENILEDDTGTPKYNVARRNQLIGNVALDIRKEAEDGISIEGSKTSKK